MKNSKILRLLCYILIPILVAILLISFAYTYLKERNQAQAEFYENNYFNSDYFLVQYMFEVGNAAQELIYNNKNYTHSYDGDVKICYSSQNPYTEVEIQELYYLITYKELAITNVELTTDTNTIEGIKNYIASLDGKKANIINGNVTADSTIMNKKAIQYFTNFEYRYYKTVVNEVLDANTIEMEPIGTGSLALTGNGIVDTREYYQTSIKDFEIYSSYNEDINIRSLGGYQDEFINAFKKFESYMIYAIPVSTIVVILMCVYLIITIGHSKGVEGIDLNDLDRFIFEIVAGIAGGIIACIVYAMCEFSNYRPEGQVLKLYVSGYVAAIIAIYIFTLFVLITLIKRIKAKTLLETSIIWKLLVWIFKIIKFILINIRNGILRVINTFRSIITNWPESIKAAIILIIYAVISFFLILGLEVIGFFIVLFVTGILLYGLLEELNSYKKIEKHLKEMYDGIYNKKLDEKEFTRYFKKVVVYVNDISSGFEKAIEEGVKTERLKTELITNVSHDIKTPLTSIINYVDLIKKENIDNEKIKEYIEILDKKSQRLKKLTEDLVEASKASSGNVKLVWEKIYLKELINQSLGEFEDRFKSRGLQVILDLPEEPVSIYADNRYMYRVIDNLFSNIAKYAESNTRVYIDMWTQDGKVKILFKNISSERLNISAEELMQRFVRGDKSRTTEGSGLGISISKSLTELQRGKFELNIDGDLFKVELTFDI